MRFSLLFLVALLVGTTAVRAQHINPAQVPATVKAAFTARFPAIKTATWNKETREVKQAYETHSDF